MKKLMTILLAAAICLSCVLVATPEASAASQDDTAEAAAVMNMMGAIQGDGSGTLGLGNTLTRAQFCKIAVVVLGLSGKVDQYGGYTIFPDVLSTDWEAGYVNLAVRYAGIMSGYADGKFRPDDIITYAQAVTVLVRMLGYTDSDVSIGWPDGYLEKADELGLTDGFSLDADSTITKGQMAVLFQNMMNTAVKDSSKTFMETISGATVVKNVFLASANAETDTGIKGAVQIAGSAGGTYLPVNDVPDALIGLFGSLILNAAGEALAFVPASAGETVVSTITAVAAGAITCANGQEISMTTSPAFYLDGTAVTYSSSWVDLTIGMRVSAYYSEGGTVAYVLVMSSSASAESIIVVTGDSYSLPAGAVVTINGVDATAGDIIKYDVIEYDEDYNVYNVTRKHITGRYESASPNAATPETIQVLGTSFELLDDAVESAMDFKIGDTIMLLLTSDNKVADVVSFYKTNINYGKVKTISGSSATVELINGITVSGKITGDDTGFVVGQFVIVASTQVGYLDLFKIATKPYAYILNVEDNRFGLCSLSPVLQLYDCVGVSSVEVDASDIPDGSVKATDILFVDYDWAGNVAMVLLDDVTGNAYTYGFY